MYADNRRESFENKANMILERLQPMARSSEQLRCLGCSQPASDTQFPEMPLSLFSGLSPLLSEVEG